MILFVFFLRILLLRLSFLFGFFNRLLCLIREGVLDAGEEEFLLLHTAALEVVLERLEQLCRYLKG